MASITLPLFNLTVKANDPEWKEITEKRFDAFFKGLLTEDELAMMGSMVEAFVFRAIQNTMRHESATAVGQDYEQYEAVFRMPRYVLRAFVVILFPTPYTP